MLLLKPLLPPPLAKGDNKNMPIGPSLNFPLSSASSQMMNKAPPSLYSSDSRIRGTFCLSQVSDRNVLSAGSFASQGDTPSCPSWHRFGVMKLYCATVWSRSEEHTSELQSLTNLVCRLLLEKKKKKTTQ